MNKAIVILSAVILTAAQSIQSMDALHTTLKITSPGVYTLHDDIVFGADTGYILGPDHLVLKPQPSDMGIEINSDDVTLNLNTRAITTIDKLCMLPLHAVTIKSGKKYVVICNGTIANFANGCGIFIEPSNKLDSVFDKKTHITLQNIVFRNVHNPLALHAALNVLLKNIMTPCGTSFAAHHEFAGLTFCNVRYFAKS